MIRIEEWLMGLEPRTIGVESDLCTSCYSSTNLLVRGR